MATNYITINDITALFRELTAGEQAKATALIPIVCDSLRYEAEKVGKDLDELISKSANYNAVVKSVCVDIVSRCLRDDTQSQAMSNVTESALGYSFSGTFLTPGGGIFIKRNELARLGLRRQRIGGVDLC